MPSSAAARPPQAFSLKAWGGRGPVPAAVLLAITALGAMLSFYRIGALSFWTDEICTMMFISHPLRELIHILWPTQMNMVLYYYLVYFWHHILPHSSDGALRAISAAFSIAAIPAVYCFARTISSDKTIATATGFGAALLLSLNGYRVQFAQELRSYSLALLLVTLSSLFLVKAIQKPQSAKFWVAYVLASTAGVYAHLFVGFVILAHAISLLAPLAKHPRGFPLKRAIVSYLAIALLISPLVVATRLTGTATIAWVTAPTLADIVETGVLLTGDQGNELLILFLLAIGIGIAASRKNPEPNIEGYGTVYLSIVCLVLPMTLTLILSYAYRPIFVNRYFVFLQPFLVTLASYGIAKLVVDSSTILKLAGAALFTGLMVLSAVGVANQFNGREKEDWRGVTRFLRAECAGPEDLRLYAPVWTRFYPGYYDYGLDPGEAAAGRVPEDPDAEQLARLASRSYREVCLVASPLGDRSASDAVRSVIRASYPNVTVSRFAGEMEVDVYTR